MSAAAIRPATVDDAELLAAMAAALSAAEGQPAPRFDAHACRHDGFGPVPRFAALVAEIDGGPPAMPCIIAPTTPTAWFGPPG
jgi:hypothetical protein